MKDLQLIEALNNTMGMTIPANSNAEELHGRLTQYINQLIQADFQKLVTLLYRIDVSETRLKELLDRNIDTDAGSIIAALIIERQSQKIKSREQFLKRDSSIDEEESWF